MAITPTRWSRASFGWLTSTQSIVDKDAGDTGRDFSCINGASTGSFYVTGALGAGGTFSGAAAAFTSTLSANGAATFQSTVTARGVGTFNGALIQSNLTGSNASFSGTLTAEGAGLLTSTLSVGGNLTATAGLFVGSAIAANEVVAISSNTAAISIGALAGHESSSVVTAGLSGATRGDTIFLTLDSIYQDVAANRDVSWFCSSSSTAGEVNVWAVNSTATSVTPTAATVIRLTRINHPSYL